MNALINKLGLWLASAYKSAVDDPGQAFGAFCGALGAWLLSQNGNYSKWGWAFFLVSNVFLIVMAKRRRMWSMLLMQVYFSYTSVNGLIHYF